MIQVEGVEEAVKLMKELDDKTSRKAQIMILRRAARPLVRKMKQLAPEAERNVREFWGNKLTVEPGTLKRSIRSIIPKHKKDRYVEILIGPTKWKAGKRKNAAKQGKTNRSDGWFRHFVIKGTAGKTIRIKGKRRYIPGQAANPFPDRAYSMTGAQVSDLLEKEIITVVNKVVNK